MTKKVYNVYENGVLIFKGTHDEIADHFGVLRTLNFSPYCKGTKFLHKYDMALSDEVRVEPKSWTRQKPIPKKWKMEDSIVEIITKYGNVAVNRKYEKWQKFLEEHGIKTKLLCYKTERGYDYVLERID